MIQLIRDRAGLVRLSLSERRPGIALVALHIVAAILPSALALSTGWLVASLTVAAAGAATVSVAVWPLVTMAVLLIADEIVISISRAVEQFVAARVDTSVRKRVRQLAFSPPDASHLEDQEFADDAARASDIGDGRVRSPGTAAVGQLRLIFRMIAAIGSAIVVAVYSPVLAAFLLLASLAMRTIIRRQWIHLAAVRDEREPLKRRVQYWTDVAASRETAKEVRLFGLHQWVVKQRTDEALAWAGEIWSTRRTILRQQWMTALLALVSSASALLFPGLAAARGQLSLAELAMTLVAAWGVFTISLMGREAFDIEYGLGAVRALGRLTNRYAKFKPSTTPVSGSRQGPPALRIVGLTFRYPGNRQPVLERLDLTVAAGEVLALVGTNGAGKTTLIKLIAGLYQPSDGVIAVDGTALTPERLASWRRRVAVVFQDFNQYPLSAADNIALAAPEFRDDRKGIRAAAERADAADFLSSLPKGFDTPLARHQTGGTDLSGGQWQRIALARAIFAASHGKDLLILDEPTAHLDVEAEARFYEQIVASVPGATIVLISHRLSTVRHADRIVFLDQGRVTEEGTHASLLAQEGTYAELFRLQAARFASALEADR